MYTVKALLLGEHSSDMFLSAQKITSRALSQWWEGRGHKSPFRDIVFDPVLLKEMDIVNQHVCLMPVFIGWLSPPERLYMIGYTQG